MAELLLPLLVRDTAGAYGAARDERVAARDLRLRDVVLGPARARDPSTGGRAPPAQGFGGGPAGSVGDGAP